jgi:hypothetical protein
MSNTPLVNTSGLGSAASCAARVSAPAILEAKLGASGAGRSGEAFN